MIDTVLSRIILLSIMNTNGLRPSRKKFIGSGKASAVDIDVAANITRESAQINDVVELTYKLRHTNSAANLFPSTEYAVFRSMLELNYFDCLFKVINDPINYGLFMNEHVTCLMIDKFLESGDIQAAAKIATHTMQQEMFDFYFLNFICLYSLLQWSKLPKEQRLFDKRVHTIREAEKDISEDDMIVYRIPFLKRECNDNHFDLEDSHVLVGKSLEWFSSYLKLPQPLNNEAEDDQQRLFYNIKLLGNFFQSKLTEVEEQLLSMNNKNLVYKEVADICRPSIETKNKSGDNNPENDGLSLLEKFSKTQNDDVSITEKLVDSFKPWLEEEKFKLVESQKSTFIEWNNYRHKFIEAQAEKLNLRFRLESIVARQKELKHSKDILYFFENRLNWEDQANKKDALFKELTAHEKEETEIEEEYARNMFEHIKKIRYVQSQPKKPTK